MRGSVIRKSNTVAALQNTIVSIASITLKEKHSYLVFGIVASSISNFNSTISSRIIVTSGTTSDISGNIETRGSMAMGGGVLNCRYIKTNTECIVELNSYGYANEEYSLTGNLFSVQLD